MNVKEVEKQVKFNLVVSCIIYILIGLCFIVSIIAIVSTPVKAATSELRTNDISNTIRNTSDCGSVSYGYFCNNASINDTHKEQINSLQVGYLYSIKMDVSVNTWFTQSPSTIEIYNSNNTFRNISYSCSLTSTNSQNNISCNVVYVNSGKIIVNFNTGNYVPGELTIRATNSNSAYMNSGNYNINRVVQLQTINSDNSDVIDNNNQNTTNIINNNNENTQDIIDNNNTNTQDLINNQNANTNSTNTTIFDRTREILGQLANLCPNLIFNQDLVGAENVSNIEPTATGFKMTTIRFSRVMFKVKVKPNTNYYIKTSLKTDSNNINAMVHVANMYGVYMYQTSLYNSNTNISFSINSGSNSYLLISFYGTVTNSVIANVTFDDVYMGAENINYCVYGSILDGNKLDAINGAIQGGLSDVNSSIQDVKDIQQDTYDYMTDDSNPSVNSSDINNVISNVQVQDPLNYLLTLPLNLLTKLNTLISADSCSRVSFGNLYDTELYLPCINFEDILGGSLWNTVDVIVGISLLVIVIKRFYDSISNILTLGKEKEVRDKLDLPTPMEFLSMILGGGK